jgi:hypothetical protein
MLDDLHSMSLLTLMEIVGPIVLGLGLWYGIARSHRNKAARMATEEATRALYRDEARRQAD